MSTRCGIALAEAEGGYTFVYCHFDGYPSGVGRVLLDCYPDRDSVARLVALGGMSVLGEIPADSDCPPEGVGPEDCCRIYHEPNHTAGDWAELRGKFANHWCDCEYLYVFTRSDGWKVFDPRRDEVSPLRLAVERDERDCGMALA